MPPIWASHSCSLVKAAFHRCFKLSGHETVVGIYCMVPACRELDLVLGLLPLQLARSPLLVDGLDRIMLGHECSFDRQRLDGKKDLASNRDVGAAARRS